MYRDVFCYRLDFQNKTDTYLEDRCLSNVAIINPNDDTMV